MTKARDLADIVSNLTANAEKAVVVSSDGSELEFGVAGGEVSTAGDAYKNYNEISTNITTTLTTAKSYALYGVITVSGNAVWTIGGSGTLNII